MKRLVHAVVFLSALAGGIALVMLSLRSVEQLGGPAGAPRVHADELFVLGVLLCLHAALSLHLYFRAWSLGPTPWRRALRGR